MNRIKVFLKTISYIALCILIALVVIGLIFIVGPVIGLILGAIGLIFLAGGTIFFICMCCYWVATEAFKDDPPDQS